MAALDRCERANDGHPITFFEITTAAALLLFSEEPADVLLLEVGLGGRLDATNVIDSPLVSVITSISHDHEKFLGNTLTEIAGEKAAIIKPGCPSVSAPQVDEVTRVIDRAAARVKSRLGRFGDEFAAMAENGRMVFQDEDGLLDLPLPALPGDHQILNAGVAIAALKAAGLLPEPDIIAQGLKAVRWPGRLHLLRQGPLFDKCPDGAEVWVDGGHNPGAAITIAAYMGELEEKSPRPLYMVSAMLTTKDPIGFFRAFEGLVRHVGTVPVNSTNAARDPFELADFARTAGLEATPFDSLDQALSDIRACAAKDGEPPRILICGSLYLVGDVLAANGTLPR